LGYGQAQPTVDSSPAPDTTAVDSTPRQQIRIVTGGPVSVAAKLAPRRAGKPLTVGDQFELELTVRRHRNIQASQPFMPEPGPFLAIDKKTVTRYAGDTIVDIHTVKMAAFATGDLKLPPFVVAYPGDSEVLAAASDSIPVKVASILPEKMEDINDLKPQVQFPNLLPLWILLGLIAAAALAYAGVRLYRRYRRIKLYGAPIPDPWDEARDALNAIPVEDWLRAGQVKRYYYTVSEILKRYLTRRFEFPAIDQTTTEIVRSMKRKSGDTIPNRVPKTAVEGFGDFFQRADMVKYAKYIPPQSDVGAVLETAHGLVKATTPAPEPAPASAEAK
jgi:hypothetical protein